MTRVHQSPVNLLAKYSITKDTNCSRPAVSLSLYRTAAFITSKIKHAVKLKTSPARLAQLLQPSLAFCFSLQPMTAYRPGLGGMPSLAAS